MFAKLFERDGEQVLVIQGQNDDGLPALKFMFQFDGATIEPSIVFKDGDWDKLESAFARVDEDDAFQMRANCLKQFGDMCNG